MRENDFEIIRDSKSEMLLKALVVGDSFKSGRPGKTALINRMVHSIFAELHKSTVGVDFAVTNLHLRNGTDVKLQLWDLAGQERFGAMTRVYYRDAAIAFIVCDLNEMSTF